MIQCCCRRGLSEKRGKECVIQNVKKESRFVREEKQLDGRMVSPLLSKFLFKGQKSIGKKGKEKQLRQTVQSKMT